MQVFRLVTDGAPTASLEVATRIYSLLQMCHSWVGQELAELGNAGKMANKRRGSTSSDFVAKMNAHGETEVTFADLSVPFYFVPL